MVTIAAGRHAWGRVVASVDDAHQSLAHMIATPAMLAMLMLNSSTPRTRAAARCSPRTQCWTGSCRWALAPRSHPLAIQPAASLHAVACCLPCSLASLPRWTDSLVRSQLAMSLAYLHDKKILHRDLKPQNVFLSKRYKMIKVKAVRCQRRLPRRRPDSTGHRIRTLAEGVGRLRKD